MKHQCEQEIGEYSGSRLWMETGEKTMRCPNEGTIETRKGFQCKLHATLSGAIGGGQRIYRAGNRYRKLKVGAKIRQDSENYKIPPLHVIQKALDKLR